ncbi:hypothetical protein [Gordonia sp. DT101]|uniref:hypothetical protein n=1 Tax=Gordonia sp. DT101 TaxID=3416545 RepID=UPI003CEBA968
MTTTKRHQLRRPVVLAPLLVGTAILVASGCTVDGQGVAGAADLSGDSVAASDFPGGSASRVPAPAVPAALADITGRPLHGSVTPPQCTPAGLPSDGAAVLVGSDPDDSTATFTSAVTRAGKSLADVTTQARNCPRVLSGSAPTATSLVTVQVLQAPKAQSVDTAGLRRQIATGNVGSSALTTGTTALMAQRRGVRVTVEYRHQGAEPMSARESDQLAALFDKAVDAAFG